MVGGSGFVGFVDVVVLLVVDGFVGFAGGWWLQGLWVLLGRWSSIFFLLFVLLISILQFSSSSWN